MLDKSFADIKNSKGISLKDCVTYEGQYYWWYDETAINVDFSHENVRGYDFFKSIQQFIICHFPFGLWFIYQFMHTSLCLIDKIFQKDNLTPNSKQHLLLARAHSGRWEYKTNSETGKRYLTSRDYEEIFKELPDNVRACIVYEDYPIPTTMLSYIPIKRHASFRVLPLMKYWSSDVWRKEREAIKYFKTVYNQFIHDETWIKECSELLGVDEERFKRVFSYHSQCSFPLCVQHHELMERLISDLNPSLLLAACEQSYLGRGWIYIAKKYNIPIVGLQHGVMTPSDYLYFNHSLEDMMLENEQRFPTPDTMLVWGQKDAEMLTDIAGYPKGSVVAIGNPKFDYIKEIKLGNVYSREKYFERTGIDTSARAIVWATQLQIFTTTENERYIADIFEAVSRIPNAVLIVKPHPLDPDKLINLIKKYIKKSNIHAILEGKNSDTIELIYISDIMIIQNSTVGLMAVALDKPLLCLDYTDKPDFAGYIADGVGKGVYKGENLHENIKSLLQNDDEQVQCRKYYLSQKLSSLDGKGARRAVDTIANLIQHK